MIGIFQPAKGIAPFYFLVLFGLTLTTYATKANSESVISSIHSDPERFSQDYINSGDVDIEFYYCFVDIELFKNAKSVNCRYAVAKINVRLAKSRKGLMDVNDESTLYKVVKYIYLQKSRNSK